jgi:molybdopterin-guanine dinucleotide biosynthesis protein MobB
MNPQYFQQNRDKVSAPVSTKMPIMGICGPSGAGKTTLIEAIVPELLQRGLRVAVVQHECPALLLDVPGRDSDRLYRSGADLFLLGGEESVRLHGDAGDAFGFQLSQIARYYDLVLVEGHGQTPVSKLWLLAEDEQLPADMESVLRVFPRDEKRAAQLFEFLLQWLQEIWSQTPVWACVLIGGRSSRMGRPKHLLEKEETSATTWLEHTVSLLQPLVGTHIALSGAGCVPEGLAHLPRLPDIPEARGPLTGILAAMRWQPAVSWLLIACDMPDIRAEALTWLLARRKPGCWGTVPRLQEDGYVEPLLAHYDYRSGPLFEQLLASGSLRIGRIAGQNKIETPLIPLQLSSSWHNINTPQELELARSRESGSV